MARSRGRSVNPALYRYPGKGFTIILDDAVGIACELDALMHTYFDRFVTNKARKRQLAVSTAITQIEVAVRKHAMMAEEQAGEELANQQQSQPDLQTLFEGYRNRRLKEIEDLRTVTAEEAKRAGDCDWARYSDKFDQSAQKRWQREFNTALLALDSTRIAPLAQAHSVWMQSGDMSNHFECNHYPASAESGIVYAKTLQLCIGSTQDKVACFDLYTRWLQGDVNDQSNLILGALTLNLARTRQEIASAATVSIDLRSLPWDGLIGNFGKAIEGFGARSGCAS